MNQTRTLTKSCKGVGLVEILLVLALMGIITAIAIPNLMASRRLFRMTGVMHELSAELRAARQQAMSTQRAVTFQYDDTNKRFRIIAHTSWGLAALTASDYPNNGTVTLTKQLAGYGIAASEFKYGQPVGAPTGALGDGISMTAVAGNVVNITFQPDGSVQRPGAGTPPTTTVNDDKALFFYHSESPKETAAAISVLGSTGRVKIWRLTNANTYAE